MVIILSEDISSLSPLVFKDVTCPFHSNFFASGFLEASRYHRCNVNIKRKKLFGSLPVKDSKAKRFESLIYSTASDYRVYISTTNSEN